MRMMEITDNIYGVEEIKEQVLVDLINSKAVQRLKGISQMGMPQEYYHKPVFSRYEHSIGVFLLLRRLNADLNEQIAGLLHDVSHTAFSHVVDWVLGDPEKEDYQDNDYLRVLEDSDLPLILKKHGFDYMDFSNLNDFSLLEKEIPSMCADRFDYAIREFEYWLNPGIVGFCVDDLRNYEKNLLFNSKETAEIFAEHYLKCQREHWAGNEAKTRYGVLSGILKRGLEKNIISVGDFYKTDSEVIKKLGNSFEEAIINGLDLLKKSIFIKEVDDGGIVLKKKFRYVDPEILVRGVVKKLSEVSHNYERILAREKANSKLERGLLF